MLCAACHVLDLHGIYTLEMITAAPANSSFFFYVFTGKCQNSLFEKVHTSNKCAHKVPPCPTSENTPSVQASPASEILTHYTPVDAVPATSTPKNGKDGKDVAYTHEATDEWNEEAQHHSRHENS